MRTASIAPLLIVWSASAAAGDICISCQGPAATYTCTIEKSEKIDQFPDAQRFLERVCKKALTKKGKHEKCEVLRSASPCQGAIVSLGKSDLKDALIKGDTDGSSSKVEGLLPGAQRMATEGLEKTGEAIKGSAKTTWDCVLSLFTAC